MTHSPLISVIIPVYNVAPYLRRCVDSLLAQTFRDFELILVDDGSSDGSGKICDEYAQVNDNDNPNESESESENKSNEKVSINVSVKVIHQPNAGVSAARNRGIGVAKGDYIAFVDADDWVEPNFMQAFAEEVERHPAVDCVVQGFVDHEGATQLPPNAYYAGTEKLCAELYELEKKKLTGYVWNKLFRRAAIVGHHIYFDTQIPIGEDFLFCMEALSRFESMATTAHAGYNYFFSGHKNYSFEALNKRLDAFYGCLSELERMPSGVIEAFLFNEYWFALYILHSLYGERPARDIRINYLRKVRERDKVFRGRAMYDLEPPYKWLSVMVMCLPYGICDVLLQLVFHKRNV